VVDNETSPREAVGEVCEAENGDSDIAKFTVDEPDTSDDDGRHA